MSTEVLFDIVGGFMLVFGLPIGIMFVSEMF